MKKYLTLFALLGTITVAGCTCDIEEKILFDTDSYNLTTEDKIELNEVALKLKSMNTNKIKIYGYADATGTKEHNLKLSKERADTAAKYLEAKGVDVNQITLGAFGEANPVATNKTKEGRKENRRVEVVSYK